MKTMMECEQLWFKYLHIDSTYLSTSFVSRQVNAYLQG
jgi:hypothetical protein